jgi:hypothetical protein
MATQLNELTGMMRNLVADKGIALDPEPGQAAIGVHGHANPPHPSGDDRSEALSSHQFQVNARKDRLKIQLQQGNIVQTSAHEQDDINAFMQHKLDEQVPLSLPLSRTKSSLANQPSSNNLFSLKELIPRVGEDELEAMQLVKSAVRDVNKKRSFEDSDQFHRLMKQQMSLVFEQRGLPGVMALFKYVIHIGDIRSTLSWKAANAYHWKLQGLIEDGEFDMFKDGYYDSRAMDAAKEAHTSKNGGGRQKGDTGNNPSYGTGNKFCSYHGKGAHTTVDCTLLAKDPTLKGQRGPRFRP